MPEKKKNNDVFEGKSFSYPSLLLNEKELDKNLFALTSILEFEKSLFSSKLQIQNIIDITMYAIIGQTVARWAALILDAKDNSDELKLVSLKGSILKKTFTKLISNNSLFKRLILIKDPIYVSGLSEAGSGNGLKENLKTIQCELIIPIYDNKELKCILLLGQRYPGKKYKRVDIKFVSLVLFHMMFLIKFIRLSTAITEYRKQKDEIMKKKLVEAEKQLVRKNKFAILGELIGSIMHEIKNPINSLYTITQVHKKQYKGRLEDIKIGELMELCHDITDETEKLKQFFDNLVNFAMRENKHIENINLYNFVNHVLSLTRKQIKEKHIKINNLIDKDITLSFDKTQLHQLFLNLVLNSIEAIKDKGIIDLNFNIHQQNFIISIEDNGKGIEDKIYEKLFEPFFTTKKTGIGLGLAICYNIVSDYGGDISIKSKVGQGTRVSLKFPNKLLHEK